MGPLDAIAARPHRASADKDESSVTHAARELEAIFVRQLLQAAHVGETSGKNEYSAFTSDAFASAITDAGGLGLARSIEQAVRKAEAGGELHPRGSAVPSLEGASK